MERALSRRLGQPLAGRYRRALLLQLRQLGGKLSGLGYAARFPEALLLRPEREDRARQLLLREPAEREGGQRLLLQPRPQPGHGLRIPGALLAGQLRNVRPQPECRQPVRQPASQETVQLQRAVRQTLHNLPALGCRPQVQLQYLSGPGSSGGLSRAPCPPGFRFRTGRP
ncbi:hypothetical protein D3C71_1384890 [compost metagenome]